MQRWWCPTTSDEKRARVFACGRVFSPAAPINKRDLFAGRNKQMKQVSDAVNTRGQHAMIFGERGVGKTSLANILRDLLTSNGVMVQKVNCVEGDTFDNVWRKALTDIQVVDERPGIGIHPRSETVTQGLAELVEGDLGPGAVRRLLQHVAREDQEIVVMFDEFDRLPESNGRSFFADTIKDLSDNSVNATLVLVGVAQDVDDLIAEHGSIDRSLVQIQMPPMSAVELQEIVTKALDALGMTITPEALDLIVSLSQGFPHYTHLLGKESASVAIEADSLHIEMDHVYSGIKTALDKTQQSIRSAYQKATRTQRKDTLFREVLLACALAEVDELNYFVSADVRQPLSRITGKDYDIPNFSQHLDKFSGDESRGPVLEKSGTTRRFRFRFRNPLLQPYVIMKGLTDGAITGDLISQMRTKRRRHRSASEAMDSGELF